MSTNVKGENSPCRFRSGHVPSVLELLDLIISTGFFNYFHSHPFTAFTNILEQVLDPTYTRHTQLYIHVNIRINFGLYATTQELSTFCSGFPRTGLVAVSPPSSGLCRRYDMSCSLSDCCLSESKSLGRVLLASRSSSADWGWIVAISTGCGSCAEAPIA